MSNIKNEVTPEQIEKFLNGSDDQKYIVGIEAGYNEPNVTLIINEPNTKKKLVKAPFKPFLWFKHEVTQKMYEGKRVKMIEAGARYGVKITALRVSDNNGHTPDRLKNGFRFMATCSKSYNDLVNYFREGGIDVFDKEHKNDFMMFNPTEQYLIQSGKRLFKGFEDYDDLHRFQFDLETEGLYAKTNAIFQIGMRDNRGIERVLETLGETHQEKRDSERVNIEKFFQVIDILQPDIITGYNSENFDWPFLFDRAERLGIPITELAITLNRASKIKRKKSQVKLGGKSEDFMQTNMYGYQIIDIAHAVRRAMAINSEIKSWGLKAITQYAGIAKPNRVYVPGNKINTIWADKVNDYAFCETNGDWYKLSPKNPLKEGYDMVKGNIIVQRYLKDDLWETEQIDNIYNQASFLIGKMLPTTYMRSSTMGTASQWKLLMAAWSYENGLAIPVTEPKRDFTGGLARLLEVGYARNVVKLDFAALYPKIELTHDIFPDLDITGVMKGMLTYIVDTRDKFKFLTGDHKTLYKDIEKDIKANGKTYSEERLAELTAQMKKHKDLSSLYDKKQLPLKILANSWFGSYGAPYIFNWGESDCAEETTCRGRQYLRLMVKHFTEAHGFKALVGDTDGFNFSFPDNIDEVSYTAKGDHWKTTSNAGITLYGLDAVLAEFNEKYMKGRMGLDIDDICNSTINFARKNYANDIGGKIKLVGNSIKSTKMPTYIEDFLAKAIRLLLDGKGQEFIEYYYEYVDKIYNYQIPMVKIASKSKVTTSMVEYRKKATMKNKKGNPMPKQAHMELALLNNMDIQLGDMIYYVNTGSAKSHGDLKSIKNKETGAVTVELNCKLIDPSVVEADYEMIKELEVLKKNLALLDAEDIDRRTEIEERINEIDATLSTDEYNVARYLSAFNKKLKPLMVCFDVDVRDNILIDIVKVKDKETKVVTEKLKERSVFTKKQCELISGKPLKDGDQDTYEDLMKMEDKEIKFWDKVNKVPNEMEESVWNELREDYLARMVIAKANGIEREKELLDDIFRRLELNELDSISNNGWLPKLLTDTAYINKDGFLMSVKWGVELCPVTDIFKYQDSIIDRNNFYKNNKVTGKTEEKYEKWLNYKAEQLVMTGESITVEQIEIKPIDIDALIKNNKNNVVVETVEKVKTSRNDEDDDDDEDEDDTSDGATPIIFDDDVDDLAPDRPEGFLLPITKSNNEPTIIEPVQTIIEPIKEVKKIEGDEWPF